MPGSYGSYGSYGDYGDAATTRDMPMAAMPADMPMADMPADMPMADMPADMPMSMPASEMMAPEMTEAEFATAAPPAEVPAGEGCTESCKGVFAQCGGGNFDYSVCCQEGLDCYKVCV